MVQRRKALAARARHPEAPEAIDIGRRRPRPFGYSRTGGLLAGRSKSRRLEVTTCCWLEVRAPARPCSRAPSPPSFRHRPPKQALEIATIASSAGLRSPRILAGRQRPFRAPHHTASAVAIVGGGEPIRAGELTLSHRGVLFLDELPGVSSRRDRDACARRWKRARSSSLVRSNACDFPPSRWSSRAMNPCPCGYHGDPTRFCRCSPVQIARYRGRVSGPLLDRFDLQVAVPRVSARTMRKATPGRAVRTGTFVKRVEKARARLVERGCGYRPRVADANGVSKQALTLLELGVERLKMSARAYLKSLRVAHTIAALEGAEEVLHRIPPRPFSTAFSIASRRESPSTVSHSKELRRIEPYEATDQSRRQRAPKRREAVWKGRHDAARRSKSRARAVHSVRESLAR